MSLPTPYFEADGLTIYNADCKTILPFLGQFDLLLTDPPYGIGADIAAFKAGGKLGKLAKKTEYQFSDWDKTPPPKWIIEQAIDKATNSIVWGGNYFNFEPSPCWLVWDKENNGNFADCELAWTNLQQAIRKIKYRWNGMLQERMGKDKEIRVHPTQKPLSVIQWAIQQAPDDCKTILDPFMGSGTTLVAARALGRQAVGIEREERYCEAAVNRLRQLVLF